jgi:hypothetical protein
VQLVRLLEDDLTPCRDATKTCRHLFSLDTMIDGYERSLNAAIEAGN